MTYEEYLEKNKDIIEEAQKIANSNIYKQIQKFINSEEYKKGIEYLSIMDNVVHKNIIQKIDCLQNETMSR